MNPFQMFFPLILLLTVSLVGGWLIPNRRFVRRQRRKDPDYDIEATITHHREALSKAMAAARAALHSAREANQEFEHLVEVHKRKAS
jgi:hypothetical protein